MPPASCHLCDTTAFVTEERKHGIARFFRQGLLFNIRLDKFKSNQFCKSKTNDENVMKCVVVFTPRQQFFFRD